jgi:hypothetical protein
MNSWTPASTMSWKKSATLSHWDNSQELKTAGASRLFVRPSRIFENDKQF